MRTLFPIIYLITLVGACAHSQYHSTSLYLPKKTAIAVMPFNNLTSYPRAGNIVAETASIELNQETPFRVIDLPIVQAILKKNNFKASSSLTPQNAKQLRRWLKTDYVLIGTVSEYRYTKGIAEYPAVAIKLRLMSTRTGKVIWRASASDLSTDSLFKRSASLDELTHKMCASLLSSLKEKTVYADT